MQILNLKKAMVQSIILVLIFFLAITNSVAQQKYKVSGKQTCAYNKMERIDVGDVNGHQLSLLVAEGVNVSTGATEFMNGAQVVSISTSDLVNFNGSFQGYAQIKKKNDSMFGKTKGKVTATLSPEGNNVVTIEGTIDFTKGTGEFANIQGSGTFKGTYLSNILYTLEWEGEYWITK